MNVEKLFTESYYRLSVIETDKVNIFNILVKGFTLKYKLDSFNSFELFSNIANKIDRENKQIRNSKPDLYNALVWVEYLIKFLDLPELLPSVIAINSRISIMQPGYNRAANDLDSFLGSK